MFFVVFLRKKRIRKKKRVAPCGTNLLNSTDVEELFSDCISFIMSSLNSVFVAETMFGGDGSRHLEIANSPGYPPKNPVPWIVPAN